jgi:hypothetical protein
VFFGPFGHRFALLVPEQQFQLWQRLNNYQILASLAKIFFFEAQ